MISMADEDMRRGDLLYENGNVQIRTNRARGAEEHDIWVGNYYFLFQRGVLREFAEVTDLARMRNALKNYDERLPFVLGDYRISEHEFALCLARARIVEFEEMLRQTHTTIEHFRNLSERM